MTGRNRTPEKNERRAMIRKLLHVTNISSMQDIQKLFKETVAEFMENDLGPNSIMNSATRNTTTRIKTQTTAATDTAQNLFAPTSETSSSSYPGTEKASSSLSSLKRTRLV